jgi:hypothetical protein
MAVILSVVDDGRSAFNLVRVIHIEPILPVLKTAPGRRDCVPPGQGSFAILHHCDNCMKQLNLLFPTTNTKVPKHLTCDG